MSESEDIIAVIENLKYIEHAYYDLQTLMSKIEYQMEVDNKLIEVLKNRLKSYYSFIPYDLSIIHNNTKYSMLKEKLEIYYYKIPRILSS
jgi:hypothetical protein